MAEEVATLRVPAHLLRQIWKWTGVPTYRIEYLNLIIFLACSSAGSARYYEAWNFKDRSDIFSPEQEAVKLG